jgi:hypothetical protein
MTTPENTTELIIDYTEMYERVAILSLEKYSIGNLNTISAEFGKEGVALYKLFINQDKEIGQ